MAKGTCQAEVMPNSCIQLLDRTSALDWQWTRGFFLFWHVFGQLVVATSTFDAGGLV